MPATYEVATGRGAHYYFTAPPARGLGNAAGELAAFGCDVRGSGGFVVAAGSLHATGVVYTVTDDHDPAELPHWLIDAITAPAKAAPNGTGDDSTRPRGLAAVPDLVPGKRPDAPGQRHETLMRYASSMRARNVPPAEAETLMRVVWERCEQPPRCETPLPWLEAHALLRDIYTRYAVSDAYADQPAAVEVTGDPAALESQHRGQVRMAYRLAAPYPDQLMHVHGIGWHSWDGRRWVEDDQGVAKRAVLDVLRQALTESLDDKALRADVAKCESAAGVAGVLDIAAALEPFAFTVADLDADPYRLNVANGTLDLRSFQLSQADPADRITKVANGAWTDEPGQRWDTFLERVLPDADVRSFLQRLAGVGLLGVVVEHVLGILTGIGRNGKGVFYGALNHALGDYATVAEPDLFMHREGAHPTGEMDLRGVRWCVVSENDKGRRLAEATMKRLTGGDEIKARRMRQDFVRFKPSHTPILVTNHLPVVAGDDPALWARIRVVPFDVVIPPAERDVHLEERLQLDADAIVSWAVEGYRDYLTRGGLDEPDAVRVATDDYRRDSDAVRRFVDECCITNPHMFVTTGDAYARWCRWSVADGAEPISRKAFGQALDRLGYPATPTSVNGKRPRRGIGLYADESEASE